MAIPTPEIHPEWLFGLNPHAIEEQEQAGQQALVHSTELPIEGSNHPVWKKLGIIFGEETDALFRTATLPKRWKKIATDHQMHTELVDEHGRVRGTIFYKAAFYDQKAGLTPVSCISCRVPDDTQGVIEAQTTQGPKILHTVPMTEPRWEIFDHMYKWLSSNYPDWKDPAAYWDTLPLEDK